MSGCTLPGELHVASVENDTNASSLDAPPVELGDAPVNGTAGDATAPAAPLENATPLPEPSPDPALEPSPEPANATPVVEAPPANATPAANDTPMANETPATNATPVANETPVGNETPMGNQTPTTPSPVTPAPATLTVSDLALASRRVELGRDGVLVRGSVLASDVGSLRLLTLVGGPGDARAPLATHVVETALPAAEPDAFGDDGFRLWRAGEGEVGFAARVPLGRDATRGAWTLVANVADSSGASAESAPASFVAVAFNRVRVAASPVDEAGALQAGRAWGGWAARPGASDVASTNFVKVTNDGDDPHARVVIDFGADGFRGSVDPRFAIPTAGNLEFAWFEERGPAERAAPAHGALRWHVSDGGTSETLQFTATGSTIFVAYRIKSMPAVLPVQPYAASYTLTEA